MKRRFHSILPLLLLYGVTPAPRAAAQAASPTITWVPGSSVKLYQVNGDCDWAEWDATITSKTADLQADRQPDVDQCRHPGRRCSRRLRELTAK